MPCVRDSRAQSAKPTPSCLGVNAVIDPPEQIVHFPRANLRFRIIERNGAAKTVLRKLQPGSRFFDVAKNIRRVLKQPRKTHDLIRFIWRQSPNRFAPLQSGSRDGKFCCELLKWHLHAVLESLQLRETQSLLDPAN